MFFLRFAAFRKQFTSASDLYFLNQLVLCPVVHRNIINSRFQLVNYVEIILEREINKLKRCARTQRVEESFFIVLLIGRALCAMVTYEFYDDGPRRTSPRVVIFISSFKR